MGYEILFDKLEQHADSSKATKMSAYMRNMFPFLGIQHPSLVSLSRPYYKKVVKNEGVDWDFVFACWDKSYREAQYVALDYLSSVAKKFDKSDLNRLKNLIVSKSWWDTVDALSKVVGELLKNNPDLMFTMLEWSRDENIWLRRVAILFQLMYKEKTDTVLLEKIIENNWGTGEFFIDKAIGWILRQYSKTNPVWVKVFIDNNKLNMSKLTLREASKYV